MKKILLAIDSFKGCMSTFEVENYVEEALLSCSNDCEIVKIPISDGGEGFLESFCSFETFQFEEYPSFDALMRKIEVRCAFSADYKIAIAESALSCGINLLDKSELRPLVATTYGLGVLMSILVKKGVEHIIVGLGGSATSDCGIGMLQAMLDAFPSNKTIYSLVEYFKFNYPKLHFTIATDVESVLYGEQGAAVLYGKQKGATANDIMMLDRRAKTFAEMASRKMGFDMSAEPGAGAAGGLGYAFMQFFAAERRRGSDVILTKSNFEQHLLTADLVITGEGRADCQTLEGKAPYGILSVARRHNVPVVLLAGQISDKEMLTNAGFTHFIELHDSQSVKSQEEVNLDKNFNKSLIAERINEFCNKTNC